MSETSQPIPFQGTPPCEEIIQAEKINALGELTAGLVHEFNSPLASIHNALDVSIRGIRKVLAMIEAAGEGMACDQERDNICRVLDLLEENNRNATAASERLGVIVGRLKSFSALDAAPHQLINVGENIDNALALYKHEIPSRVSIHREYGDTPVVPGQAREINLAFLNLIKNAVQAIDGEGDITITTRTDDSHVIVEIADTGRGVPEDRIDRLFAPSFTTHNDVVRMNTGLPISYNILKRHSGEITISSQVGVGTTVTVKLPRGTYDPVPTPGEKQNN
jgi:two-component system NtrC family sensor kinase